MGVVSSRELTPAEQSLLTHGLSFAPTPHSVPWEQLCFRFDSAFRQMTGEEPALDIPNEDEDDCPTDDLATSVSSPPPSPTPPVSPLSPPSSQIRDTVPCVRAAVQAALLAYELKPRHNLSKAEQFALDALLHDDSLVILPADKGNVIVVLNFDDYVGKCRQMVLAANDTYSPVDASSLKHFSSTFNASLRQMLHKGLISDSFFRSVRCHSPEFSLFYGLPKIHKIENIKQLDRTTVLSALKFRPIISACNSVTFRLQKQLVPLLRLLEDHDSVSSTVLNVYEFIDRVRGRHLASHVLVKFDIDSMFTSVPVAECLDLIFSRLKPLEATIKEKFGLTPETVLSLVKLCGTVLFRLPSGECFEQIIGFPMGGPISPLVCSFFVHSIETKALSSWIGPPPSWWYRYVDDVSSTIPLDSIEPFLAHLNRIHPAIKWTVEVEKDGTLSFLDCLIIRDGDSLKFSLFKKPTSTSRFIDASSCHAVQHKRAWILTSLYRIDHVADEEFRGHLREQLRGTAKINGYSSKFVDDCFQRFDLRPSRSAADPAKPLLPFVCIPYLPGLTDHLRHLCRDLFTVVSRPCTLWNLFIRKVKFREASASGEVYIRKCADCPMEYTGESGLGMNKRNAQHDAAIDSHPSKSAVAWHAVTHQHSFLPPVCLRKIHSLPQRRFTEALYGRICPPSKSINMECSAAGIKDGDRSPGHLWDIDAGWIIIAHAKKLRLNVEKTLSSRFDPAPQKPSSVFVPCDSSLSCFLPQLEALPPPVREQAPAHDSVEPCPFVLGAEVWTLCLSNQNKSRAYAGKIVSCSPLSVQYRTGTTESDVPFWRLRSKLGRVPPRPWAVFPPLISPLNFDSPPPKTAPKRKHDSSDSDTEASPPKSSVVGKTVFVDQCLDPQHATHWASPLRPRSIRSERFVSCAHGFCKYCCSLHCRTHSLSCRYHSHSDE